MKLKDLTIYIDHAIMNVKRNKWDIEQARNLILLKLNDYLATELRLTEINLIEKDEKPF